ncbi:hypothetical protein GCM10010145_31590 [Streptomyces ruber]|uniref:Uncharacterized protein n=2 Tax=Streptomyces TaxID=1883 RepID=A0A918BEY5_9ACTN|nr:hypothetical protein [Streptomyces ruber]GGQ59334.1 hypothetical protein GCM10010145_31590 [Streptomyces ruber]
MRVPNVIGDWQECEEAHAGLRVRVHGVERAEPPRGRDEAAEGLVYFRFRVTVENRTGAVHGVHLEDGQIDVRAGDDGEGALLDWRNSQFVEGFDLYPLRRVTAVVYAAAADAGLGRLDIQVQPRTDDDWGRRYLWAGAVDAPAGAWGPGGGDTAGEGLAGQISRFLGHEAEQGPG